MRRFNFFLFIGFYFASAPLFSASHFEGSGRSYTPCGPSAVVASPRDVCMCALFFICFRSCVPAWLCTHPASVSTPLPATTTAMIMTMSMTPV